MELRTTEFPHHRVAFALATVCACLVSGATAQDLVGGNFRLKAPLDEPQEYCLDVFGFGTHANIEEPLSAHTCKTPGWRDASFVVDHPDIGQIYAPAYYLCAELSQVERGGHLFLKPCSDSPLQRFFYREDQKIEVQTGPGPRYCIVVHPADGIATGGPSHVRREVMMLACDTLEPQFAQWSLPDGATSLGRAPEADFLQAGFVPPDTPQGAAMFYESACGPCHGPTGQGETLLSAPKLSGLADWYLARQIRHFSAGRRGRHSEERWANQMRDHIFGLDNEALIEAVSAYISALPDEPVPDTVRGGVERGARLYEQGCALCHGADGMGVEALNAPRQAGMTDWYLIRQLEKFRDGLRGDHPEDTYGAQMIAPSRMLPDEQAVLDVIAYINSLPSPR